MNDAQLTAWRDLADDWALALDATRPGRWAGTVDGVAVAIELEPGRAPGLRLSAAIGLPTLLMLPLRCALRLDQRRPSGDPDFDAAVYLHDPDPHVHALLDAETRAALRRLVHDYAVVAAGGLLRLDAAAARELDAAVVGRAARELVAAARRLVPLPSETAFDALLRLASDDAVEGVRKVIADLGAELPPLREALAVKRRPRAGSESELAALAAIARDATQPPGARTAALVQLIARFPTARFAPLVLALRRVSGTAVLDALCAHARTPGVDARALGEVLAAYVEDGDARAGQALQALMTLELDGPTLLELLGPRGRDLALERAPGLARPELGVRGDLLAALLPFTSYSGPAYLRALGELGDARFAALAEDALSSTYGGVPEAAADALARLGDLGALERLRPLTSGFFRSGELKAAAARAIAAIRERHGVSANPGALSLAEGDRAGGLSLGDAAAKDGAP